MQLTEKEDPYSYYRGKAESFTFMTPKERVGRFLWVGTPVGALFGTLLYYYLEDQKKFKAQEADKLAEGDEQTITNWSGTHEVTTKRFYQPTSLTELEEFVAKAHRDKTRLRVVGAALSPNGIGLDSEGMISLALMDRVLAVDTKKMQVTVEAGARVSQVIDALKPYGLTLQNLASIDAQQIGGFMSVSAHGTGATLPPVDQQVVSYTLVTPGQGTLKLSADDPLDLSKAMLEERAFDMARVGLGALGVVADVTLQCVPAHQLHERTWVTTMADVEQQHADLVTKNRHIRYMWIPYTDAVVVVASNPVKWWSKWLPARKPAGNQAPNQHKLAPMRELLQEHGVAPDAEASLPQLRDELLKINPLDVEHIKRVNRAEAECWKNLQGERVEWSDRVLGFECGGQQWVSEVCFPAGAKGTPDGRDLEYAKHVLNLIEEHQIAAPAPLEQRWTAASSAPMSPAHSRARDDIFSWLGIIMYLPPDDVDQRLDITDAFTRYKEVCFPAPLPRVGMALSLSFQQGSHPSRLHLAMQLCRANLWQKFGAKEHWAKIESPHERADQKLLRERLQVRLRHAGACQLTPTVGRPGCRHRAS